MGVTLERVQNKFACIIGELCSEPDILSQFAIWLDLRLAEYKLKGAIVLDCSGQEPDPTWLRGYNGKQRRKQSRPRAITPHIDPEPVIDQSDQAVMEEWYVEESEFSPCELVSTVPSSILQAPPISETHNDVVVKKEIIEDEPDEKVFFPPHVYGENSQKRRALDTSLDQEATNSKVSRFSDSADSASFSERLSTAFNFNPSTESNSFEGRDLTHAQNELSDSVNTTANTSKLDMSENTEDSLNFGTELLVKQDNRTRDFVLMTSTSVQTSADKIAIDMEILRNIHSIQTAIGELQKEVGSQQVLKSNLLAVTTKQEAGSNLLEETLPLNTLEELDQLEERLQDKETLKCLTTEMCIIGGTTLKEAVRRIMSRCMCHNLALKLNWVGKKGWRTQTGETKRAFRVLRLCDAIKRAILKNTSFNTLEDQVEKELMLWLRNSSDRNGGRRQRGIHAHQNK